MVNRLTLWSAKQSPADFRLFVSMNCVVRINNNTFDVREKQKVYNF